MRMGMGMGMAGQGRMAVDGPGGQAWREWFGEEDPIGGLTPRIATTIRSLTNPSLLHLDLPFCIFLQVTYLSKSLTEDGVVLHITCPIPLLIELFFQSRWLLLLFFPHNFFTSHALPTKPCLLQFSSSAPSSHLALSLRAAAGQAFCASLPSVLYVYTPYIPHIPHIPHFAYIPASSLRRQLYQPGGQGWARTGSPTRYSRFPSYYCYSVLRTDYYYCGSPSLRPSPILRGPFGRSIMANPSALHPLAQAFPFLFIPRKVAPGRDNRGAAVGKVVQLNRRSFRNTCGLCTVPPQHPRPAKSHNQSIPVWPSLWSMVYRPRLNSGRYKCGVVGSPRAAVRPVPLSHATAHVQAIGPGRSGGEPAAVWSTGDLLRAWPRPLGGMTSYYRTAPGPYLVYGLILLRYTSDVLWTRSPQRPVHPGPRREAMAGGEKSN
ncbi:hypothetical protein M430DRAFT_23649 [Amorphotheca resinae ATCC 22711]|uniref:Uncharacterized protein n=1 Tax=Amorphotheca resinae ATCC 22711 TaxID=857342 RepID=A0A2T3BCP6_AMORE|nr:hypothetical protein M430DRAFT_23649 [Amorphotheca resinae ATCC 22711]PSS27166.1 hypothetical protein M430DRAFT_23649 [Amorphotheca resinae ATCC 22711]